MNFTQDTKTEVPTFDKILYIYCTGTKINVLLLIFLDKAKTIHVLGCNIVCYYFSSRTKLERDVDYLMGEVKRLKGRVKKLEHVGSPETQKMETQKMETQKMESKEAKTCQPQETTSSVVQIIEGSNNVSQAITTLLKTLFTNEELKSCSITGKKSPKCIGQPRPPLDQGKFEKLCECVRAKFPGTEKKIIIEKIQNIQKVLRRQ